MHLLSFSNYVLTFYIFKLKYQVPMGSESLKRAPVRPACICSCSQTVKVVHLFTQFGKCQAQKTFFSLNQNINHEQLTLLKAVIGSIFHFITAKNIGSFRDDVRAE